MGLIRGTGPSIRSLYESGSAIEQMTARMLHEHGARPGPGEVRSWQASMPVIANELIKPGFCKRCPHLICQPSGLICYQFNLERENG